MLYRIGNGFADGEVDRRDKIVVEAAAFGKLVRQHCRLIDRFYAAGELNFPEFRHNLVLVR